MPSSPGRQANIPQTIDRLNEFLYPGQTKKVTRNDARFFLAAT